jgi:peptidoglycan/xylan/chitin deacetylase (PgdA/CDA1 family)
VSRRGPWPARALARRFPDVLFGVATARPAVALTLDDGPDPDVTPAVLDVLASAGARATFFMLGEAALANGPLAGRAVAEGHELGNHGWRDRPSRRLPLHAFVDDLRRTHAVLGAHAPVRLMRPGSGLIRRDQRAALPALGYRCVLGSAYLIDAQLPQGPRLAAALARLAAPGAIVILHEGEGRTRAPAMLAALLERLAARGLTATTVGDLLRQSPGDGRS